MSKNKNHRQEVNKMYGTRYIVEEGDNLYDIAERFNTTVEKLILLNNLTSDKIYPGEIIIVDDLYNIDSEPFYVKYTVRKKDTIYSIAYNYGMTPDQLLEINNMLDTNIKEGQTLLVFNNPPIFTDEIVYKVKAGDSIYSIAEKYHTTVKSIKELNNLTSEDLVEGMGLIIKLDIPEMTKGTEYYTVEPGDSLYSIATKHNTTVNIIKRLNNLSTNLITIGQQLVVPKVENGKQYY